MTFIIHFKDGHRETYNNRYDEDVEHERDAAWDDVYMTFPDAEYITMIPYRIKHKATGLYYKPSRPSLSKEWIKLYEEFRLS